MTGSRVQPPRSLVDNRDRRELDKNYPILYVDDERENRVVFQALFGGEFTVICASSPSEALQVLARQPVAILVSDQRMPEMSGIELCERVRQRYPTVIRLLVTAYSDHDTAVNAINDAGVAGYLVKPWDVDEIFRILSDMVSRAHNEYLATQLRSALLEKERLFGLAATRAHILHDLGNIHVVVADCGENLAAFAERIEGKVPPELLEELRGEVDELKAASDYIMALHDRTHAWDAPAEKTYLHVTDVLDGVAALVRNEISPSADLTLDCPEEAVIWADRIDVSRILVNLVLNAAGALATASLPDGEVRVSVRTVGERVAFEVADNGPGFPSELRSRALRTLETGTTELRRGPHGLGLSICRELAAANNGSIELVDPPQGRGETFRLTVPVEEPA